MRYFTLSPLHKAERICVALISFWIHSFTRKILCWNFVKRSDSWIYWDGSEPARLIHTKPNFSTISLMSSSFQRLGVLNVCRKSAPQSSFNSGRTGKTKGNKRCFILFQSSRKSILKIGFNSSVLNFFKIYFKNNLPLLQAFLQKVARKIQFRFLCVWSQLLYHLLHHSKHTEYCPYTVKGEFLLHSSNPKGARSK